MSLIDWSDPEEMLGLLVEYVADEAVASHDDAERARFLNQLSRVLRATAEQDFESVDRIELALREIHDSQPREFASDPVMAHVEACIEELHRIGTANRGGAPSGGARRLLIALLAAGLLTAGGCATHRAAIAPGPLDDTARIAAARRMMIEARYCALITVGEDGQPQARAIDPSPPDARMVVWFVTDPATRKVRQIERDPRVTLYYFDARSPGYVTVIGTASLVADSEAKQKRWLEKWTPFYRGGPGAAVLFEVTPRRIEIVDVARGIVGDPHTWAPPSVDFKPQ